MPGPAVEICIHATDAPAVHRAVQAAYHGGADRVELCRAMEEDGLTPALAHIEAARSAFSDRPGLLVMLRPRGGDFQHTQAEIQEMLRQMPALKAAGADGVVLGVLRADGQVDVENMHRLRDRAGTLGLAVTFHRAFDAVTDRRAALETLVGLGVDRVLTAGVPWGQPGTVQEGVPELARTLQQAAGRLEVVVGGGVRVGRVQALLAALPRFGPRSVHAYTGVQVDGVTDRGAVRALVRAVQG